MERLTNLLDTIRETYENNKSENARFNKSKLNARFNKSD